MSRKESDTTRNKTFIIHDALIRGSENRQDIVVEDGRVVSVGKPLTRDENAISIDAGNHLLLPGFVDLYSRCREPGLTRKGTIASESIAALAAGFTQVLCSPDTIPVVDNVATVELISHRSKQVIGGASVIPMAALTLGLEGEQLSELATLQSSGCPIASQADQPIASTNVLYSAMEYASSFKLPLLMNARDAQLGVDGCAHTGSMATRLGLPGIPVAAESVELSRLIELSRETGCAVHVSRISSARAVEQIHEAKQAGLSITCDVGIHHLFFTDELLAGYDSSFHSRVPFRSTHDRDQLRVGLANGTIDCICSDHSPHDIDASLAPFPETEPGLSAYDWFTPLMLQIPQVTGLNLDQVISKLHDAPHAVLGSSPVSAVQVDHEASFFLLDINADLSATNVDHSKSAAKSGNLSSGTLSSRSLSAGNNNPLAFHKPDDLGLDSLRGKVTLVFHNGWVSTYS